MATTMNDQRTSYQPVLSTTLAANYLDFENDRANIRAGKRTQQAITNRHRWQYYLPGNVHKRARLSPENDVRQAGGDADTQLHTSTTRNRHSLPVRIVRRLTSKYVDDRYDPDTIPVLTKRAQRKLEKRERRQQLEKQRIEELAAQELAAQRLGRQQYDHVSHQLELNEREKQMNQLHNPTQRTMRDRVKDTLKKSTKIGKSRSRSLPPPVQMPKESGHIPHIDDFESKSQMRLWFEGPSDVEALPPPQQAQTIAELPPAVELPAVSISPPYDFKGDVEKRCSDGSVDFETLPPPIRSPSPCLSSVLRRGITLSESPPALLNKQMQCDYCHDAIKLAGFHYACIVCDDGDRLYCAKCANGGRTCRHQLIERTRNIKRHPTNPQLPHNQERRSLSLEKDSVVSADGHAELSAAPPLSTSPPLPATTLSTESNTASLSKIEDPTSSSPTSIAPSTDVFREFEAERREREIAFREKEVTLREREAMLREREAWTASRERDAALVQQLHAAAMLQRERSTEVGAQFMSAPSRQSSCSSHVSCGQNSTLQSECSRLPSNPASMKFEQTRNSHSASRQPRRPSFDTRSENIRLHSFAKGKKPNIELASTVAALEASVAGIEMVETNVRNHANSTKRKAPPSEGRAADKSPSKRGQSSSSRNFSKKRTPNNPNDDDEDSEGSEEGSPKKQKQEPIGQHPKKLFACPYFKFEPIRYAEGNMHELHYRGCAGGLFRDISRVKQHLKRVHHRPDFYCRRCFEVFESSQALQIHSSRTQGCNAETCPFPEKLDETQQNKIHVKRPGKNPEDLWYDIFKIIFPGVPVPDSPYIESTQPKSNEQSVLEQFVRLFESKLDTSISSQPWLSSSSAREFIRVQMRQTMQETIRRTSGNLSKVPSVMVSPVSPVENDELPHSRHTSQSSRASSSSAQSAHCALSDPAFSPVNPVSCLRPALKVTTRSPQNLSSSSGSSLCSAKSQVRSEFPSVASHVQEDLDGDGTSRSWRSGDDVYAMSETVQEPASATSTRSGKSVTFATPPQFLASWHAENDPLTSWTCQPTSQNTLAPDLSYFTSLDWSAESFALRNQQPQPQGFGKQHSQYADSGYGTLSSQPSRSSVLRRQSTEHHHDYFKQPECVDPQMLFVNPADADYHTPGISADLQAYLNRDSESRFGYQ